jgi:diacylglycerol kinase family enzyme
MIVFINPQSGQKTALKTWSHIQSLFKSVQQVIETTHPHHAQEICQAFPDHPIHILILGGDGLIHEIIQGCLHLKRVHLSIIPCGSGNALACSLGIYSVDDALNYIHNHRSWKPLKLSRVLIQDPTGHVISQIYSFCVVSWGFHASIVKYSESLRFLGSIRFLLIAIYLLLLLKTFECEFTLMTDSTTSTTPKKSSFTYFLSTRMTFLERGFKIAPDADFSTDQMNLITTGNISRSEMYTFLMDAAADGKHTKLNYVRNQKALGFRLKPLSQSARQGQGRKKVHDICIDGEMVEVDDGCEIAVDPSAENIFYL